MLCQVGDVLVILSYQIEYVTSYIMDIIIINNINTNLFKIMFFPRIFHFCFCQN